MRIVHISEIDHIQSAAANDFEVIKAEVVQGLAVLVEFDSCYCVLRHDRDGLCVVCAQGKNLLSIAPYIVALARYIKAPSIVYHTKRKALKRLLSTYSFVYEATDEDGYAIYRMALNG
ncbi:hypothetical protein PA25_04370 [Pseudoalteromonas sp. A25]|uniref:hypothetical protein n=1 Tax=Pseudoalteromonas sp. A25 TaxID=116092 RepID=UPI001260B820|nr:hypothetical protein [Pseudoalteromonas sp. A25]BBN80452.1 hypothetical protein PA25_04370 [Pseudoalteromonas sp. A25]